MLYSPLLRSSFGARKGLYTFRAHICLGRDMTSSQQKRWNYELAIIKDLGRMPSSRELADLLKKKYNLNVSHGTVNDDLKKDLEALTTDQLLNKKDSLLGKLEDELDIAHEIAQNDMDSKIKLDAMKTVAKLSETISKVCAIFAKSQAEANQESRPVYKVSIGKPEGVPETEFNKMEKKENEKTKENTDENNSS